MKWLKNLYYYLKYGASKLYPVCETLDVVLIYLEEVGIKNIDLSGDYYGIITFNDDTIFKFWNCNKWYGWMSQGDIQFSNGKEFRWEKLMPNFEILYKIKCIVRQNEKIHKIEVNDYTQYLPIKIQRKMKLKKLK